MNKAVTTNSLLFGILVVLVIHLGFQIHQSRTTSKFDQMAYDLIEKAYKGLEQNSRADVIELDLPISPGGREDEVQDKLTITIDQTGIVRVDGAIISLEVVESVLMKTDEPSKTMVILEVDDNADNSIAMRVIDACRESGLNRITMKASRD